MCTSRTEPHRASNIGRIIEGLAGTVKRTRMIWGSEALIDGIVKDPALPGWIAIAIDSRHNEEYC